MNQKLPNFGLIEYVPRLIHNLMGETSHPVIAQIAQIREQEKLRADPRFPLFQMMERNKRYQKIFNGPGYGPIFK
jgi:hypothetical protein